MTDSRPGRLASEAVAQFTELHVPPRATGGNIATGARCLTAIMGRRSTGGRMTSELPRASLLENVRFTLTNLLPSMLRGLPIPLPFWTEVATRFDTGRGVATVERLTERYAGRPVMLRSVGGKRCSSLRPTMSAGSWSHPCPSTR